MTYTNIQLRNLHTVEELKDAIKKSSDEGQKTRLRALIAFKEGATLSHLSRTFAVALNTIRNWIRTYNDHGIDALVMDKGGRPKGTTKWDTHIFTDLVSHIDSHKDQAWSIPLMKAWITQERGLQIPETTIFYHLQIQKYSYKSVRPHPYKGDENEQKNFKKTDSEET